MVLMDTIKSAAGEYRENTGRAVQTPVQRERGGVERERERGREGGGERGRERQRWGGGVGEGRKDKQKNPEGHSTFFFFFFFQQSTRNILEGERMGDGRWQGGKVRL